MEIIIRLPFICTDNVATDIREELETFMKKLTGVKELEVEVVDYDKLDLSKWMVNK